MSILDSDVKLLKSEHMTDLSDSGGFPSGNEVLDNVDNNVFPDIASGDRVTGRAQTRLIYGAIRSPDTDVYMGSRAYIASPPSDAAVDVAIFHSVAGCDQQELLEPLYRYATKSTNSNYRLYSTVGVGDTQFTLYSCYSPSNQSARPTRMPKTGDTVLFEDVSAGSFQSIQINKFLGYGGDNINYITSVFETSKPFKAIFNGAFYVDADHVNYVTPTQIYFSSPQEIPICGIRALEVTATSGTNSLEIVNNQFLLAPQVGYSINGTAKPEGVFENYASFTYSAPTSGINLGLPVIGSFNHLKRITTPVPGNSYGAWRSYDVDIVSSTDYFLVTLPTGVSSGAYIIYYCADALQTNEMVFRLNAPVIPNSLSLLAISVTSVVLTGTDDGLGELTGTGIVSGIVDYDTGLVIVTLTEECEKANVNLSYQYTTYIDAMSFDEIGIDTEYLPPSKTTALFGTGDSVLVHNTLHQTLENPVVSSTTYTLSRANVDQIWLEAANGTRIPTSKYTKNLVAGSVTMGAALDLTGYAQPLEAYTTIQDEAVIVSMETDGQLLQLNRAITHTYPATSSYVSSIINTGDLFASANDPFAQQAWTSVWSDTLIGSPITPQYNNVTYPIEVTNDGAITERWRIHFTGTTTVNIIGERVGQIATGLSITSDIAPVNPHTLNPYFTIQNEGWGAGWVSGNLLRFNTESADTPIGVIRVVQPSVHVPGTSDRFRLTFLGDVDV